MTPLLLAIAVPVLAQAPELRFAPVSHHETEISRCPAQAEPIEREPDPDFYAYAGFRYVRPDGSTCGPTPSLEIEFTQEQSRTLSFEAKPEGDPVSFRYDLAAPRYVVRRNFYFRTQADGTRRFYSLDLRRYTGNQTPERVRLEFLDRAKYPLLPWEKPETFRLGYGRPSGAALDPQETSYEYALRRSAGGDPDGILVTALELQALKKKELTPPDPGAVTLTLVTKDSEPGIRLALDVRDKWSQYYGGEKLGLKIKVSKAEDDELAYDIDVPLDAAPLIRIVLGDPRWEPFRRHRIRGRTEYYVEWGFRRAESKLSSGEWVPKGKTGKVRT